MDAKSIDDYLKLPYTIEVIRDTNEENPGWVARVVELPGCFTQSDDFEDLQAMVEDAMRLWISAAIEDGLPVPEPRAVESYSGKFIVRVPKSLHRQLVERAEHEDISLNQFVSTVLAKAVGALSDRIPTAAQVSAQEIRGWIMEAVQQTLRDTAAFGQGKRVEATLPVPAGKPNWESMKVAVIERQETDYLTWFKEARQEMKPPKLGSSILDNLLD